MLTFNWLAILGSGLVPMAVGALWYGPLFGKLWMKEADMSLEKIQGANMAAIYGVALLFSMMFAVGLLPAVVHQMGVFSTLEGLDVTTPGSEVNVYFMDFMSKYGSEFRTFKHGAFHGLLCGIFLFLPVLGTNALFERRSWKYILLNVGYWTISAMIMGGIISAWG